MSSSASDKYLKSLDDYVKKLETPRLAALRQALRQEAFRAGSTVEARPQVEKDATK